MAKVKIFEAEGITKYNHNHDPATGRFTTAKAGIWLCEDGTAQYEYH